MKKETYFCDICGRQTEREELSQLKFVATWQRRGEVMQITDIKYEDVCPYCHEQVSVAMVEEGNAAVARVGNAQISDTDPKPAPAPGSPAKPQSAPGEPGLAAPVGPAKRKRGRPRKNPVPVQGQGQV